MFNENDLVCPVELTSIELYLQILKPAYLLSLAFQISSSSIADTIQSKSFNRIKSQKKIFIL